ncbi:TPA: PTS transporter subunit EIIB [Staphylococcus aureus]|nr:PTS transporter subunit EIIB [Staphylococcus aureus]
MAVKREDVKAIVTAIGGKENLEAATHCVTRLRLVLKDESKVDKDALSNNALVKGQFKADHQYQIVIGPGTVDEVYKQFIDETGAQEASKDEAKQAAAQKGNPVQRLIKLLGDIFIPILPAIVTAGLLMGINNLLTMKGLFGPKALIEIYPQIADISNIINVIASTAFIFLPALIGWSSMRVFGGTYLWPIVAISNICQGSAAFGAWFVYKRRKMVKEEGLALTSGISGMLGVTEPAMFGVNLPLKYPFIAAISTSCVLGAIVGMNNVLGKVGVGGVPAFISIQKEFWLVYLIVTAIAIVVPCILTIVMSHFSKQKAKEIVED